MNLSSSSGQHFTRLWKALSAPISKVAATMKSLSPPLNLAISRRKLSLAGERTWLSPYFRLLTNMVYAWTSNAADSIRDANVSRSLFQISTIRVSTVPWKRIRVLLFWANHYAKVDAIMDINRLWCFLRHITPCHVSLLALYPRQLLVQALATIFLQRLDSQPSRLSARTRAASRMILLPSLCRYTVPAIRLIPAALSLVAILLSQRRGIDSSGKRT